MKQEQQQQLHINNSLKIKISKFKRQIKQTMDSKNNNIFNYLIQNKYLHQSITCPHHWKQSVVRSNDEFE